MRTPFVGCGPVVSKTDEDRYRERSDLAYPQSYPQSFKESGADSMIMYGGHGPPNSIEGADSMKNGGQKE